jgi:hypothetical protein
MGQVRLRALPPSDAILTRVWPMQSSRVFVVRVEPNGSLFALMNLLVHTIMYPTYAAPLPQVHFCNILRMYAYYAATGLIPRGSSSKDAPPSPSPSQSKDAKPSKPKRSFITTVKAAAAVTITPLQILQMIIGSYAIFHTHSVCPDTNSPVFTVFGGVMYVSYLALFLHMFSGKINQFFGGKKAAPRAANKAE